jgi:hypothetical protein
MFAPDIQTSLELGDSRCGFDMQSLLFWIFQVPVHFRPISLLKDAIGSEITGPMGAIGDVLADDPDADFLFAE